ncbi:beta-ketoacyl synthase N-terminal-like domain-containing protein [Collimonas sp.]|jgi:phthiocerol/phenolphthiocerol synthesis type-I polyketide synthase E|uniref:beta-ketoacyl synthase N-terminal-like domain-containing protein n=1 Tax=Collimonas sp. TaxID=1963772 RepID=UPI002B5DA5AE|nr:beta-ketoacyl synthase N-terminal-like domain-containing protein [Collimonas sp.]HWW05482.1 beta-ketoacyl synthase N-terminal-like domain-containing protein [Collimonas sp.]
MTAAVNNTRTTQTTQSTQTQTASSEAYGGDSSQATDIPATDIAIIGMAGRLPGADNLDQFWQNLLHGQSGIRELSEQELQEAGVPQALIDHPYYVRACATLRQAEYFDAAFFGISDAEAQMMDPQQRMFLETTWRALEDAGHAGDVSRLRIGVFGSTTGSSYAAQVAPLGVWGPQGVDYAALIGNDKDFLATRTSYFLGLTGPSLTVQTACSSSLSALHIARAALLARDCDLAVVGGVSITFPQQMGYLYKEGGIFSPDGACRVFADNAQGTLKGNGVAVVVLRRYQDAVADRDQIIASIAGSAMNNDGADKVGFTAPSPGGQVEVIKDALAAAQMDSNRITYVEAHGTGTHLGDPIEIQSLARAYGREEAHEVRPDTGHAAIPTCYLGSAKANIGHLDAAAGVVGLIKAVKVLQHQQIPQQIACQRTNPVLQLEKRGFAVRRQTIAADPPVQVAAVSAFGIGGSNVHVILRRAPQIKRPAVPASEFAFVVSGKDHGEIASLALQLITFVEANPTARLDDMALTLGIGRRRLDRCGVVRAASHAQLAERLSVLAAGTIELAPLPQGHALSWLGDIRFARRMSMPGQPMQARRYWPDQSPAQSSAQYTASPANGVRPTATADPLVQEQWATVITEIFSGLLNGIALGRDDDLTDMGLDSMGVVEAATQIRDRLQVTIGLEDIEAGRTVNQIVQRLQREAKPQRAPDPGLQVQTHSSVSSESNSYGARLLMPLRPGPGTKVCLIHPAGGSVLNYVPLARQLPDEYDIYGIAYPTRSSQQWSIRQLASRYLDEIRELGDPSSLILGGYSYGGNMAFEMALQLQAQGQSVRKVLLLDSHPPAAYLNCNHLPMDYPKAFVSLLPEIFPGFEVPAADFAGLSIRQILARIGEGRWSAAFEQELYRFFEIWRENYLALKHWHPAEVLQAPAVMIEAQEPENAEFLESLHIGRHGSENWRHLLSQELKVVPTPGNHLSMIRNVKYMDKLAEAIADALE